MSVASPPRLAHWLGGYFRIIAKKVVTTRQKSSKNREAVEKCSMRSWDRRNGGAAGNDATFPSGSIADGPRPGRGSSFTFPKESNRDSVGGPDKPSAAPGKSAATEHQKMGNPS